MEEKKRKKRKRKKRIVKTQFTKSHVHFSFTVLTVYIYIISKEQQDQVKQLIKSLCQGFVAKLEKQLVNFLANGEYHAVDDPLVRERHANSKLTNLLGEACFRDLEFSLFKLRMHLCIICQQ